MLSFTGIFLAFPDAGRAGVAVFASVSPSTRGMQAPQAAEAQGRTLTPDEAVAIARARYPAASVAGIGFPAGPRGVYRIALREPDDDNERGSTAVFVDPRSGAILRQVDRATQTSGDAFLAFQRPLHEGDPLGIGGRIVIAIVGIASCALRRDGNDDVAALAPDQAARAPLTSRGWRLPGQRRTGIANVSEGRTAPRQRARRRSRRQ